MVISRLIKIIAKAIKNLEKVPHKPSPPPEQYPSEGKNFIYLSSLEPYLERYNLSTEDENSVFMLRSCVIDEGKKLVIEKLNAVLQKSKTGSVIGYELLKTYRSLKDKNVNLPVRKKEVKEDKNTPKIFKEAFSKYIKEFELEEEAEKDLKNTILILIDKLYNRGKEQMIKKLEPNMELLEKYLSEGKSEEVKDKIREIKEIINEYKIMIQEKNK